MDITCQLVMFSSLFLHQRHAEEINNNEVGDPLPSGQQAIGFLVILRNISVIQGPFLSLQLACSFRCWPSLGVKSLAPSSISMGQNSPKGRCTLHLSSGTKGGTQFYSLPHLEFMLWGMLVLCCLSCVQPLQLP